MNLKISPKIMMLVSLLCILILCLPIHQARAEFTYTESDPTLELIKLETYKDETTVVRVIKDLKNGCWEPAIRLRIIYANGTVTPLDIYSDALGIPEWNFCRTEMGYHRIKGSYGLRLYSWMPNYVLITYMNGTSYDDQENMSVFAKLISWSGKVIGNEYLGPVYIVNKIIQYPIETHFDRVQPERGFFYADFLSETNYIFWVHFSAPDENGTIKRLRDGTITLQNMQYGSFFYTIPTLGGGDFGIVIVNSTVATEIPIDHGGGPLKKQLETYAIFISSETYEQRGPYFIHHFGATPALALRELACGIEYYELKYNCFLVVRTNLTERSNFLTRLTFTVTGSKIDEKTYENNEINSLDVHEIYMESLYYGGYLLILHRFNELDDTFEDLYGYIFDREANLQEPWPLGNPTARPALGRRYGILFQNNTLVSIIQKPGDPTWTLESKPLKSFVVQEPYENPNVITTDPPNNSKISLRKESITITFKNEIYLSTGNITVFQLENSEKILKQTHPGTHPNCILGSDRKTVTINMLESNFNIPNGTYTVEIAHEFFVDKQTLLAPLGLRAGSWNFTTENTFDEYPDSVDVVLGLTREASANFKKLTDPNRAAFMNQLSIDLTKTIPTEPRRFIVAKEIQNYDKSSRIIISLKIREREGPSNLNGKMIIRDLDTLIRNKAITAISRFESTSMLDEEFGSAIRTFFAILLLLNCCSCCIQADISDIFVMIKISLATLDFIFDIWFIATYSFDFKFTLVGSIVVLVVPWIFNIIAFIKVSKADPSKPTGSKYIGFIYHILGFIDVEALKLVKSITNSSNFLKYSYWMKFALQDIPQLMFQILYFVFAIKYNTLITISIILNSLLIFHSAVVRLIVNKYLPRSNLPIIQPQIQELGDKVNDNTSK
ncbi:16015_t:CDS:10 [Funneliformis caledonium]|uniref:16015_t:CDS:1 n=1 Tax=Funneliformis caledonium TaxID=1117310 RepID=A0A9N9AW94_9GLOM|nr:16015_t:CDS:10 [Funneliformis caledonium]